MVGVIKYNLFGFFPTYVRYECKSFFMFHHYYKYFLFNVIFVRNLSACERFAEFDVLCLHFVFG